ncbi:hypothetical protein [Nostoc sp.]|uniref:hypothetical protein n=1 Tax=Nostoc sp. TaxID=1180 RepID=UPI002FF77634
MAMTEAELAAQTYTQNSESLARLKSNHRQFLTNQQSLQSRIINLHNRESEVSLAISDLDIWLCTANLNIVNVVTQCLQNRQDFTVDLISLPSGLGSMTIANQPIWQQSIDQYQLKVNEQMSLAANEQQRISANQEQLEVFRSEADFKFTRTIAVSQ